MFALAVALALAAPVPKDTKTSDTDWPTFRGTDRTNLSKETGLLAEWPKDGPTLLWSKKDVADVGCGYGSPAIVGGKIYMLGGDGAKQTAGEFVTCLDMDGKQQWQTKLTTSAGKYLDGWGGGPRGTPTVDGEMVYVLGATGDLVALTTEKGEVKWTKNLVKDFGGGIPTWGYSESVTVDGDNVIVTPGGKTAGMVALEKATGKEVWKCAEIGDGAGYSSVVIAEVGGVKQYITQTMKSGIGVRAKDGKLLWKAGEIGRATAVIPTPVVDDKGYVFFTSGYGAGCECFQLSKDGEGTKAEKVYTKNKVVVNHHGGVVRVGDHVYGHSDNNGWVCFDYKKGGEDPVWKDKGVGKGSITSADGWLFCYSEQSGKLARVKATEKGYEESGSCTIPETCKRRPNNGKVWAHPVVSGGRLYLRDYEMLFVYDIGGKK